MACVRPRPARSSRTGSGTGPSRAAHRDARPAEGCPDITSSQKRPCGHHQRRGALPAAMSARGSSASDHRRRVDRREQTCPRACSSSARRSSSAFRESSRGTPRTPTARSATSSTVARCELSPRRDSVPFERTRSRRRPAAARSGRASSPGHRLEDVRSSAPRRHGGPRFAATLWAASARGLVPRRRPDVTNRLGGELAERTRTSIERPRRRARGTRTARRSRAVAASPRGSKPRSRRAAATAPQA